MKITRKLSITSNEFYDALEESILNEIGESKNLKLDGYIYTKNNNDANLKTKIHILKYQRGVEYKVHITTNLDEIILHYCTKELDDSLEVCFSQDVKSINEKKGILRMWSELFYLGRMSDTLYSIQNSILEKKENRKFINNQSPFFIDNFFGKKIKK